MDVGERVDRAVTVMAEHWIGRKWEFLAQANEEFSAFVDPAAYYRDCLSDREAAFLSACFTEWVLFDRPLFRGATPLRAFIEHPVGDVSEDDLDCLRQIERTHFVTRFAIGRKHADAGTVEVRDVRTGLRYLVLDPHLCGVDRWRDGSISMRVACVDDVWQTVGRVHLYDRAPPGAYGQDGPGEVHPEDLVLRPEVASAGFYLRLLRDVIGFEGRYHQSSVFVGS